MQQKDRDRLLVLITLLGCILLFIGFIKGTKFIPSWLLITICLILQQFYAIPKFVGGYYKMFGERIGFSRFIPIYNELSVMSPKSSVTYLILCVATLLCGLCSFINPATIGKVFGVKIALTWNNNCIIITILLFIILCIFRGVVYIKLFRDIQVRWSEYADYVNDKTNCFNKLFTFGEGVRFILLFIPLLRTIGIVYQLTTLDKLVKFGNYSEDDYEEEELEEELEK